jgi:hypothetical protein
VPPSSPAMVQLNLNPAVDLQIFVVDSVLRNLGVLIRRARDDEAGRAGGP